jgi:uncharacterized protein involved in exopolysaccharide biosynthesis
VNDVRVATAVSPVYLESLRSYERFAASDSLFAEAVKRFRLQDESGAPTVEVLKRRVLRVSKPRDTRILEMSATLTDPQKAHELIVFLAEKTVALNHSENIAADREMLEEARRQVAGAQQRLAAAQKAAADDSRLDNPGSITESIKSNLEVLSEVRQKLIADEALMAEYEERVRTAGALELPFERRQAAALKARVALLHERVNELTRAIDRQKSTLAARTVQTDQMQTERRAAEARVETALTRLRDVEAVTGSRGERLRIIDPGIVPQRPSSPDLLLNVVVALLAAGLFSVLYVTAQFGWSRRALRRMATAMRTRGVSM